MRRFSVQRLTGKKWLEVACGTITKHNTIQLEAVKPAYTSRWEIFHNMAKDAIAAESTENVVFGKFRVVQS